MRRALIVAAACVAVLPLAAQEPADSQFRYGARLDVDSFAYRRLISTPGRGLMEIRLDAAVFAHARPDFADLRIVASDGRQVPYLVQKQADPQTLALPPLVKDTTAGHAPHISRYTASLPYPRLPAMRLVLRTSARVFEREVWVEVARGDHAEHPDTGAGIVARAWWSHADPDTEAAPLTLDMPAVRTDTLHIGVDEGDNAPLPLDRPTVLLPSYRVLFVRPEAGPVHLLYGNPDVDSPRYDLALVSRRLLDSTATPATVGPERPPVARRVPAQSIFWYALAFAVLVLVGLIVRLVRHSDQ